MSHAWCRDIQRDESVRAAEDNRQGPLPTLEECIERQKHAAMTAGVKEGFVKADGEWKRLTDDELRQVLMIPKTVSPSSAPEHENKGHDMGGSTWFPASEQTAPAPPFAEPAKCSPAVSETGEGQSGLRTERVTLEITHKGIEGHAASWDWDDKLGLPWEGESVRVVEEPLSGAWAQRLNRLTDERDAAIRERESLREQLESVACRAATAETALRQIVAQDYSRAAVNGASWKMHDIAEKALQSAPAASGNSSGILTSSPAASGAAGSYWMVRWPEGSDHDIDDELFADEQTARHMAELEDGAVVVELVERHSASGAAGTEVVAWRYKGEPWFDGSRWHDKYELTTDERLAKWKDKDALPLYAAPQAAKGWLTAEERGSIQHAANLAKASWSYSVAQELENILARSTPPEVVLPECPYDGYTMLTAEYVWCKCVAVFTEALAAAGVKVKEVGK